MKKILLSSIIASLLILPVIGLAVTAPEEPPETDVLATLDTIVTYLFGGLITIAAICFIIAGYYFVTAAGDPEKVGKARMFVLYAVIGLIVAFLARGFIALVRTVTK